MTQQVTPHLARPCVSLSNFLPTVEEKTNMTFLYRFHSNKRSQIRKAFFHSLLNRIQQQRGDKKVSSKYSSERADFKDTLINAVRNLYHTFDFQLRATVVGLTKTYSLFTLPVCREVGSTISW